MYELSLLHIDFETYELEDVVQSKYDRLEESYLDLCNIWAFITKWAQKLVTWLLIGVWYGLAYPIKFVVWGGLDLISWGYKKVRL